MIIRRKKGRFHEVSRRLCRELHQMEATAGRSEALLYDTPGSRMVGSRSLSKGVEDSLILKSFLIDA